MPNPVRTAIFPVAGMGTRFLPATKATPKELLPVIDKPLIQFAIEEAQSAGIERFIFVSHPTKSAIQRHVMDDAGLRASLTAKGKFKIAEDLQRAALKPDADDVIFEMQHEPLGLGHAVLCAKKHVLPGPVAVLLPDDLILGRNCLQEMIGAYRANEAGHMVASMRVSHQETQNYGILSVTRTDGRLSFADNVVEKPKPEHAPSQNAVVGRYILDGSIFDDLENQQAGTGGEIQLTDAIDRSAGRVGLSGFRFSGTRFDCGSKAGMLRATIHRASQDAECCNVLKEVLTAEPSVQAA
ncbi:MAG: UTP--glucose-1-phosphate uridylyltransferase [Roseobacter sp.]